MAVRVALQGNYRCSLAGCDLNRRWASPSLSLHPTIHALRCLLQQLHSTRGVALFVDLHGHSRRFNVFTYGCPPPLHAPRALLSALPDANETHNARGGGVSASATPLKSSTPMLSSTPMTSTTPLFSAPAPSPVTPSTFHVPLSALPRDVYGSPDGWDDNGGDADPGGNTVPGDAANPGGNTVPGVDGGCGPAADVPRAKPLPSAKVWPLMLQRESGRGIGPASGPRSTNAAHVAPLGRFVVGDCSFAVQAAKRGTARVVAWKDIGIHNAFTLEASFCGAGPNSLITTG